MSACGLLREVDEKKKEEKISVIVFRGTNKQKKQMYIHIEVYMYAYDRA